MRWSRMVTLVVWAALGGCASVTSLQPVGHQEAAIEVGRWQGRWRLPGDDERVVIIDVEDGTRGLVTLTVPEDGDHTRQTLTGLLRAEGDALFLNIPVDERSTAYAWFRVVETRDTLVMWLPNTSKFRALVSSGALPGRVERDGVVLGALSRKQVALVASEIEGVLVDWKHPIVLWRVSQ